MAAAGTGSTGSPVSTPVRTMALLSSLFFMWGFITVINDTLLPHLRSVFALSYTETTAIESTWFVGYLVASLPAARLIARIGYQRAMVTALGVMTLGSLGMVLAASLPSYAVTLAALFTVSCGIALLQVAANPYVAVIGPPQTAESRLNLAQAFNTTGDVLAIVFGQYLILGRTAGGTSAEGTALSYAQRMADARATELPYLIVAVLLAILTLIIARAALPALGTATARADAQTRKGLSLWRHRGLVTGCGAIFLYVLAEIGVGNLFINFASQPGIANVTHEQAAFYLMFVWGGMMVGRFAGAWITRHFVAENVLALFAVAALVCALVATFAHGHVALAGLIAIGLFNSIMFPTIFGLAIRDLGPLTEEGSGLLIMAIAGGALVFIQGSIADHFGIQWAFAVTAVCELYVLFFALWGCRAPVQAGVAGIG